MRLDPDHVRKLARAIEQRSNGPQVKFDLSYMDGAMERLTLWEQGVLITALMRSARARRRTPEQRALLALFVCQGGNNG